MIPKWCNSKKFTLKLASNT